MKTRCPNCETLYDIDEAALAAVDYTAVCCQCHQIFTAEKLNGLKESVVSPLEPQEENDWALAQQGGIEDSSTATLSLATDVPEDFNSLAAAELEEHHFSKPQQIKKRPSLIMATGILLLALVAAAQFAWINKQKLLEHPQGRLLIQEICELAECELERRKATDKFTILHRDLQPDISDQQALSFTLSFTNDATFSQLLPILHLSLLDDNNELLAQRSFSPDEYLYPATGADRSMKPKEIINIELLLQAANLNVSDFTLDFL